MISGAECLLLFTIVSHRLRRPFCHPLRPLGRTSPVPEYARAYPCAKGAYSPPQSPQIDLGRSTMRRCSSEHEPRRNKRYIGSIRTKSIQHDQPQRARVEDSIFCETNINVEVINTQIAYERYRYGMHEPRLCLRPGFRFAPQYIVKHRGVLPRIGKDRASDCASELRFRIFKQRDGDDLRTIRYLELDNFDLMRSDEASPASDQNSPCAPA